MSVNDLRRIAGAALDEVGFHFLQAKAVCEIVDYQCCVQPVLAGIYIGAEKSTIREGVNTDMAFGDYHETAPAAGVFVFVARREVNLGIGELFHCQLFRQFVKTLENTIFIIQPVEIPSIAVNGQVFTEMAADRIIVIVAIP